MLLYVVGACAPSRSPAAVAGTSEGPGADTWRTVEVKMLVVLLLDESCDDDATMADACSTLSDVMPLAASSSLTRAKYVGSG